jgi:hypothetical protein
MNTGPGKHGDLYDSGLRKDIESDHGVVDPNTGHQTQVYPDNRRASRNGVGEWHHTDQNEPKGSPDRHSPPPD